MCRTQIHIVISRATLKAGNRNPESEIRSPESAFRNPESRNRIPELRMMAEKFTLAINKIMVKNT